MENTNDQGSHAPAQPAAEETPAFLINGKRVIRIVTTLFLAAILLVFPIYYQDYYFDIPKVKYQFYYISALAMFAGVAATALSMMIVDLAHSQGRYTAAFFDRFSRKKIGRTLTAPDVALICFLAVAALSTVLLDYVFFCTCRRIYGTRRGKIRGVGRAGSGGLILRRGFDANIAGNGQRYGVLRNYVVIDAGYVDPDDVGTIWVQGGRRPHISGG